ncbi:MAG TPA: Gfo/Idh/MocA family oxidoreductase [Pirellulaceae bacterium]|nr:Gfo/Idh/MocA family oxidoreductase [Pirellulaceae bacterium]
MTIGFGIIGCGMISRFHAKAVADIKGAQVAACFDSFTSAADKFGAEIGCQVYHDLDAMLADKSVDVVTICTPSGVHMEPAVAAAKAGKHIIVEKPLDITLKRCDAMIAAADKAGVVLSTIFPSRFHESSQLLKGAIDKGRFGKLTMGDAYVKWFRTQEYYDSGAWRGTWALDGGGALMNQAVHSVDLLLWFMGPAVEVTAYTATLAHERIEVEDVAVATVKFASGALGVIEASTATWPGELKRIEISGNAGSVVLREEDLAVWKFAKETKADDAIREKMGSRTHTGGGAADPKAIGHHGHTLQFQDVLNAIKKGKQPLIDGPEGRRAVELILAIYKSAESGKPVQLPLAADPVLKGRSKGKKL